MLSLCLIVKPADDEAKLLDRCLGYVAKYVDEICLTITGDNKKCEEIGNKYKAKISKFEWVNDFAKARNYNFSQAAGDYLLWLDTDDLLKGAEKLKGVIEEMQREKIDVGVMDYLYDFNENGECTVKHLKTRIVKNDGCVSWEAPVHEDFRENRNLTSFFIKGIEVLHLTNEKRVDDSAKRNLEIAEDFASKNPKDPRSYWLLANAYTMENKLDEAKENYIKFLGISQSEEEKYIVLLNLATLLKSPPHALEALHLRPTYPDAYMKLGELLYGLGDKNKFDRALNFIELGLQMPKPDKSIIFHNPRDYDYNPLMLMFRIYYDMGKIEKAVLTAEKLYKLFPKDKKAKQIYEGIKEELGEILNADKYLEKAKKIKNKDKLEKYLDNLPPEVASHPKICYFRNEKFVKEESSGKDLVYYCSFTSKAWNPEIADKEGVGGSEEAVINLSKRWAKMGWNVTVYNNCGQPKVYDGVKYEPYWKYNFRDKQDVTIFWRSPMPAQYEVNSDKIFIDLHDVIGEAEFTKERLEKIDKIFVKSKAQRKLFPNIPDEKFAIIPNGVDPLLFEEKIEKNPYLILNTSSPDRHLDATLDIFEELIKRSDKPWKLAWYYGWGVYDQVHADNKEMMDWKDKQMARFDKLVAEGRAEGGYMISHPEIAKKYLEAGIFLYSTSFYEIHCISAVKAQLAGCRMITSDFAALEETVNGIKIHTEGKKWGKESTFGDDNIEEYIKMIISGEGTIGDKEWAKETYNWDLISSQWNNEISNTNK